jgi:hypothetical protein
MSIDPGFIWCGFDHLLLWDQAAAGALVMSFGPIGYGFASMYSDGEREAKVLLKIRAGSRLVKTAVIASILLTPFPTTRASLRQSIGDSEFRSPGGPDSPQLSTIQIPVTVSLDQVFARCEQIVPESLDESGAYVDVARNALGSIAAKYRLWRDPLKISMEGSRFTVDLHAYYWIDVAERIHAPIKGEILKKIGSCGLGEDPREVEIGFTTLVDLGPDWKLIPTTTVRAINFPNRCRMTRLNIDVTDSIATRLTAKMRKIAALIDERIRAYDLRSRAETVWRLIQKPVRLDKVGAWLSFAPVEASLSPLKGSGKSITTTLGLTALTSLVMGEPPGESSIEYRPLSALKFGQAGPGIHVVVNSVLPFSAASDQLRMALVGREYRIGDNTIVVSGLTVSGEADTVKLQLEVTGWLKGTAYLQGKLAFDPQTSILSIRDLDLSVDTQDSVTRGLADMLLRSPNIRAKIATAASWSMATQIGKAKEQIRSLLNHRLGESMYVKGDVTGIRLGSLIAVPRGSGSGFSGNIEQDAFIIQVIVDGVVTIEIG